MSHPLPDCTPCRDTELPGRLLQRRYCRAWTVSPIWLRASRCSAPFSASAGSRRGGRLSATISAEWALWWLRCAAQPLCANLRFTFRLFGDAGGYFPGFPGFGGPMIAGGLPYPMAQPMMTQPMMTQPMMQPMMQTMPQPVLQAAGPHPAMPAVVPQPLPAVVPQPLPLPVANPVVVMSAGALIGNVVDAVTGRAVAGARIQVRGRCLRHRLRPR